VAEASAVRRIVRVLAFGFELASALGVVVGVGGPCGSADDADRVAVEYGSAEGAVSGCGVSALVCCAACAVGVAGLLGCVAFRLAGWALARAGGDDRRACGAGSFSSRHALAVASSATLSG